MKATFNISIVHHPSYVALSNMPSRDVSEYKNVNVNQTSAWTNWTASSNWTASNNWTITTFEKTPNISTYITAFVVCNFDYVTTTEKGNEIRIWAQKDAIRKGFADYALNITGPIFSFMEDLFNVSYPLPKTDLIALPDLEAGAMENWGLMTFLEPYLLQYPEDEFMDRKSEICRILSHEIGHQWFGNLVTIDWWNELWLNEGFATYLEYRGLDYIEPSISMNKAFSSAVLLPMLRLDGPPSNRSLSTQEKQETDFFDSFSYRKGASIVRMLCSFMNERLFIKALNVIDEQNDFQLPTSVKVIMDSWTCQNGFPVLTVDPSTGTISQEKFYFKAEKHGTNSDSTTWIIPISWIRNGTLQPLVWLDKRSKVFPEMKISNSEHDWIILNVNMTGYYRVNYDRLYWRRLAKVLEKDPKVIPAINRLQLLDDSFHLMQSGYTELYTSLYLTKYLEKEYDLLVWYEVLQHLEILHWTYTVKDYELYPLLKKYILRRILPVYHHYAGILRQNYEVLEDDYFAGYTLETIFGTACWLGVRDCLELVSEIFSKWIDDTKHKIPDSIKMTVFCYGIEMGTDKEWDLVWEIYNNHNISYKDKHTLVSALICTREPWLLQRYLQYSLNTSHVSSAIFAVASTEIGYRIAWEFLIENWLILDERIQLLYGFLDVSSTFITTDSQIQEFQLFLNKTLEEDEKLNAAKQLTTAKSKNEDIRKIITKAIKWLKNNTDD